MFGFLLTSFVFTAVPQPPQPVRNEPFGGMPRVVHIPGRLQDLAQKEFNFHFNITALGEQRCAVCLSYINAEGTQITRGPQNPIVMDMSHLLPTEYEEFLMRYSTDVPLACCYAYRYVHEYRTPKRTYGAWRTRVQGCEKTLLGGGQGLSLLVYFLASQTGGMSTSVASAVLSFVTQFGIGCLEQKEQEAFKVRNSIDEKLKTLLQRYDTDKTRDAIVVLRGLVDGLIGYHNPGKYSHKLPLSWPHLAPFFPKQAEPPSQVLSTSPPIQPSMK